MHFSTLAILLFAPLLSLAVRIPNADTPTFYLVSSSSSPTSNLLPVRMGGGLASLTGSSSIAKFYFWQGQLTLVDPLGFQSYRPLVNTLQTGTGTCAKSGELVFVQGGSSNKCASYSSFQIQSNGENSQLGAKLVFNYVGDFYSCGSDQKIYYKYTPTDGPSGCNKVDLYTVPLV